MLLELLPYGAAVALYSISDLFLHLLWPSPLTSTIMLKCLPVLILVIISVYHTKSATSSNMCLKLGLLSSAVGDGCLVLPAYFLYGVGAFGVAHICYIITFGFEPRAWRMGLILAIFSVPAFFLVAWPIAGGFFLVVLLLYSTLLFVMMWRAFALATSPNLSNLVCACGAASFIISDIILILNKFHSEFEYSQVFVLGLYYFAQAAICFSVMGLVPGATKPLDKLE